MKLLDSWTRNEDIRVEIEISFNSEILRIQDEPMKIHKYILFLVVFSVGDTGGKSFSPMPSIVRYTMKRRKYIATISAAVSGVALAGCSSSSDDGDGGGDENSGSDGGNGGNGGSDGGNGGSDDGNGGNGEASSQEQPSGTRWYDSDTGVGVMEGVEAELDSIGSLYIRGTVENFSDTDYDYVQLEWEVYDDTGAKIADGLANTSGLDSGQRWRFEAVALSAEGVDSYNLVNITAY